MGNAGPAATPSDACEQPQVCSVDQPAQRAHPVKTERHDTGARLHHTNTGIRPVDLYCEHRHGLYVSRRFVAHPRIAYWQAHLLPSLGLQICRYDFHGERAHDYYIDIATITREGHVWSVRDQYLDLLVWDSVCAEIADTDELNAAYAAGYLGQTEFLAATLAAHRVLNGLARHGYELDRWLAGLGVRLDWDRTTWDQLDWADVSAHERLALT